MSDVTDDLEAVLDRLERIASRQQGRPKDAIDRILESPRRRTETQPLRNSPALTAFRRELTDGLIRADTANQLLRLISSVLAKLL